MRTAHKDSLQCPLYTGLTVSRKFWHEVKNAFSKSEI